MTIKETFVDLCNTKYENRAGFITDFLSKNSILYSNSEYKNIEIIKKSDTNKSSVVFFSHYDISKKTTQGANDNTSSVAVLLHTALFLKNFIPQLTVRLVFNDREESLGAIGFKKHSPDKIKKIIKNAGSYLYLENIKNENVKAVFILELSGIGDSIFIAKSSGNIECDAGINDFLNKTAELSGCRRLNIPIPLSDMVSVYLQGLKGSVYGSIPYFDGLNYLEVIEKKGFSKNIFPYAWKNSHTDLDNVYSIREKSLEMIYNYTVNIIKNIEKLKF